ncbi:MAG: hypothetical protein HY934_00030 [Candidatus Firestonebacteria bacterium]|nr:hypothetical protein [Candidatus Firestonebacteria bacterium]
MKKYISFILLIIFVTFSPFYEKTLKGTEEQREKHIKIRSEELKEKIKQKKEIEYQILFEEAEKYFQSGKYQISIEIYNYLLRKGYIPDSKIDSINIQIAEYFSKYKLYGIAIGYYEEQLKQGKSFSPDFFLNMSNAYTLMGKLHKAKKIYEEALSKQEQPDNIINEELKALDELANLLNVKKPGILEINLIHPGHPYVFADPMLLEVSIRNMGFKALRIDSMMEEGIARSLAISFIKNWSRIVTYNNKNVAQQSYTHPVLEYNKKFPPVNKKDIITLGPGEEYNIKINLWKYLESYKKEIEKENEYIKETFKEYFICAVYGDFLISKKEDGMDFYSVPTYSNAILVSFINEQKGKNE